MSTAATDRIDALCGRALTLSLSPDLREKVIEVRSGLRRPVRLAVVGRIKSGKSTLVNALLGQRVARADASECTRAVTTFSYGHQEKVVVHARDGRTWALAFDPDGHVPADLGAPPEDIATVEVVLCNEALRATTVVDTPGLDSLTADAGQRTEELLGLDPDSRAALHGADAVLFLVPHLTRDDDRRLRALAAATARTAAAAGLSPATLLAVLSRADTLAEDADEGRFPAAESLAARYADELHGVVAGVVPVAGLLAQAADAALVTEAVVDDLAALAALPDDDREFLTLSTDLFLTTPVEGGPEEPARRRLLDLLGLVGVRLCLARLAEGREGATATTKHLRAISGIETLHDEVRRLFTERAGAIAAHRALVVLDGLTYVAGAPAVLRDLVEEAREDPALQELREREVLLRWSRGELTLPPDLADDVETLVRAVDDAGRVGLRDAPPPLVGKAALDAATRWLRFANDPRSDLAQRRAAEVVRDSFLAVWERTT